MRIKSVGTAGRLTTVRAFIHRFAFVSFVGIAVLLMMVGKADVAVVERTRTLLIDITSPILDALSRPAAAVSNSVAAVRDLFNLRAENQRLAAENQRLMHWQTVATRLEGENAVLHQQLNFIPEPDPSFITARVIGDVGGSFGHSMLLAAGAQDGVRKGQAVLSGEVLVGYIGQVGDRSSRLLLLTDINAHLPVLLESTHTRAILSGDNMDMPRLDYLAGNANIQLGDRVVTSSSGAAFPPGLPIGTIAGNSDGTYRVEPFVHRSQLEFVAIVDYGLGGILPYGDKAPAPVAPHRRASADSKTGETKDAAPKSGMEQSHTEQSRTGTEN